MKKNKSYITALNVFSSYAVVMLHANNAFWKFSYARYWRTANIIESVFYFAVPCFFMISGCNLLDYRKKYDTKVFFEKRIHKTVLPFVFWSIVAFLYSLPSNSENISLQYFLNFICHTKGLGGIYWYFPALFGSYLAIPMLSIIPDEKKVKIFTYCIGASFAANSIIPLLSLLSGVAVSSLISMPLMGGYLIYILLGYVLDREEIDVSKRRFIYFLGIIGLLVHIIGTKSLSYSAGEIVKTYKGYLNVPCVLYSVAVYVFFKYELNSILEKVPLICNELEKIGKTTFGVYLLHWYVLDFLSYHSGFSKLSIVYRIVGGTTAFLVTAIIVKVMQKIPYIRKLLP